jgi:hypothetical protein
MTKGDIMTIRNLKHLFAARVVGDDGTPVRATWIGDDEEVALIDRDSGRVLAHVWHDGYGKYYPTVYALPWQALRVLRQAGGYVVSVLPFPRLTVELLRLKAASIGPAQAYVDELLGLAG